MKLKKFLLAFVLALVIIPSAVIFTGCGASLTGTWKFYQLISGSTTYNIGDTVDSTLLNEDSYNLILNDDGTWQLDMTYFDDSLDTNVTATFITGTWTSSGNQIVFTSSASDDEEDESITCEIVDGKIYFSPVSDFTIIFVK